MSQSLDEMHAKAAEVIRKAKTALEAQDERLCRQLLREVCFSTTEYVTK